MSFDEKGCSCLATGSTEKISVEKHPDLDLVCPFSCLVEINGVINRRMEAFNGDYGDRAECDPTLEEINDAQFGNGRGYVHTADEDDTSTFYQPTNEKVVKSAAAALAYINEQRTKDCPTMPTFEGREATVEMARGNLVEAGHHEFMIEMTLPDKSEWAVRVAHKTNEEMGVNQTADELLLNDYNVMSTTPLPCATGDSAQLATTYKKVREINLKQLPWKATYKLKEHFGKTIAVHKNKLGLVISEETKKAPQLSQVQDTTGFTPLAEYDARDAWPEDGQCQIATNILDQKSCGSCYAFAAAAAMSYRLCMQRQAGWNMVINPQELMDCSGSGCSGGDPLETMMAARTKPAINNWCEEYTGTLQTCGTTCPAGVDVYATDKTGYRTGFDIDSLSGADRQKRIDEGVLLMQKELFENGPFPVAFKCYDDFFAYKSGIYTVSSTYGSSVHAGGHAVILIGWGEENGIPYWLIQNSWGANVGELDGAGPGVYRFRRGTDEALIESWGGFVMRVTPPDSCPGVICAHGGEKQKDCSCKCSAGFEGADCKTCSRTCGEHGVLDASTCSCKCYTGASGKQCQNVVYLNSHATCAGTTYSNQVTLHWDLPDKPIVLGSMVAAFNVRSNTLIAV